MAKNPGPGAYDHEPPELPICQRLPGGVECLEDLRVEFIGFHGDFMVISVLTNGVFLEVI